MRITTGDDYDLMPFAKPIFGQSAANKSASAKDCISQLTSPLCINNENSIPIKGCCLNVSSKVQFSAPKLMLPMCVFSKRFSWMKLGTKGAERT